MPHSAAPRLSTTALSWYVAPVAVKRVEPDEAAGLIGEGWSYLDVRSVPEFEQGHPEGAYNIPIMHSAGGRMQANPDFVAEVEAAFAKETRLVVGCKSGGRSLRAAEILTAEGYTDIIDMRGGFGGEHDPATGQVVCAGWQARELPVTTTAGAGRSYAELKKEG